jgi:hypothetical protein
MARKKYITPIRNTERLGDSLVKINNNFLNLKDALCNVETQFDSTVAIRTFFYYGPNSSNDSLSNMDSGKNSYPSNRTIERFCNESSQLNLTTISKNNDEVYVIYQKTGYYSRSAIRNTNGLTMVIGPAYSISGPKQLRPVSYTVQSPDAYNVYLPIFVIYKLIYRNRRYSVQTGFPKFSQGITNSTTNWSNPQLWGRY